MIVNYTTKELDLLARIMRAEALGEGSTGMLLVGNVVVNRAKAQCPPFKKTNTIYSVVYKKGQFEGVGTPLFNKSPTKKEKDLFIVDIEEKLRNIFGTKVNISKGKKKGKIGFSILNNLAIFSLV